MARSNIVADLLSEYGNRARALLSQYLPRSEPRRYLYDPVADYPSRGGRAMRPTLCLATTKLFGGNFERALPTAVSIELFHNALLIHDDIEDESDMRRGKPTMHAQWGVPMAVNIGDALTLLSLRPLFDNVRTLGPRLTLRLVSETENMARESAEGQALELGWRLDNRTDITQRDYLEMVLKKTCWLATIHPMRTGALIATQGAVDVAAFVRYGLFVGAAFQIQDDLLNLTGDEKKYGKELGGDLFEGKRTLMLIHLFEQATPSEREKLGHILTIPRQSKTEADVRWIRDRMDSYGSIEHAVRSRDAMSAAAQNELTKITRGLPGSRDKDFLEALATWVVERT
ncbi:MAG: polyprenyl synthetase family protein [Polyangiaceae bacterium]|nr:polyprenyl synthetase family protein [Polyangiaceae bacterium]